MLESETMTYRVVRSFAICAVLVHMVFGCCWHHAHAYETHLGEKASLVETPCGCDRHGHESSGQPYKHGSHHGGCDGAQCVFTRAESGQTAQGSIQAHCLPLMCVVPGPAAVNGIGAGISALHHSGPPIPLHLLNQALLL